MAPTAAVYSAHANRTSLRFVLCRVVMQTVCENSQRVCDRLQAQVEEVQGRSSRQYALHNTARHKKAPNDKCRRENATQSPDSRDQ
jgi:hypothetical protein